MIILEEMLCLLAFPAKGLFDDVFYLTQNKRAAVNKKALGGDYDRYEGKATFMG
jgi:hypothetical protein